jgi:hypothetical protein
MDHDWTVDSASNGRQRARSDGERRRPAVDLAWAVELELGGSILCRICTRTTLVTRGIYLGLWRCQGRVNNGVQLSGADGSRWRTPASVFGRHEAQDRRQAAPGDSSPPCAALRRLHDGGEATAARIDVGGQLGFCSARAELKAARVRRNGSSGGSGHLLLMDKTRIHLRSASVQTYTFFTTGIP